MNLPDRLTARALLIDELYVQKSQLEHAAAREKKRADNAEAEVKRLTGENAVLRGEPKPD